MQPERKKLIIGVTGTTASGKDTVGDYISNLLRVENYSTSDEIGHVLTELGLEHSRPNKVRFGNELRERHGTGELARRALCRVRKAIAVITALRNIGEIEYLRANACFRLIAVDAPLELRHRRMLERNRLGDERSFEGFEQAERAEMAAGSTGQQLAACMEAADFRIYNDSNVEWLHMQVDLILEKILHPVG